MNWLTHVHNMLSFRDVSMTLTTNITTSLFSLFICIALLAKCPSSIFDKPRISQSFIADLTTETIWMPVCLHCLDHSANHKLTTLFAAWSKQSLEVLFTVSPLIILIKQSFRKWLEALHTNKTPFVKNLTIGALCCTQRVTYITCGCLWAT